VTDDATVNVNTPWGKLRAVLTSKAAGTSLILATYFLGAALVLGVIAVAPLAMIYGYDLEASLRDLSFKLQAPETPRNRIADRKSRRNEDKTKVTKNDSFPKDEPKRDQSPQNVPRSSRKPIVVAGHGYYWERVRVVGDVPDDAGAFGEDEGEYAREKTMHSGNRLSDSVQHASEGSHKSSSGPRRTEINAATGP
jgi:hypothetical protein